MIVAMGVRQFTVDSRQFWQLEYYTGDKIVNLIIKRAQFSDFLSFGAVTEQLF